jgi:hypothetical protein
VPAACAASSFSRAFNATATISRVSPVWAYRLAVILAVDVVGYSRLVSGDEAGRGHCSGTPALPIPWRRGSSWARYVGSSLIAVQAAWARETVKAGLSARPALTAERASSNRPRCPRAAANRKYGVG